MRPNSTILRTLAITIATLGLAACSDEAQERYVAELRGSNEVPANSSTASGRVELLVYKDASSADYSVEVRGLSAGIQGGHFHRAAAGANGPVIVSFFATNGVAPGSTDLEIQKLVGRTLTKAQLDLILTDLRAGNIYANVHTPNFPGGEVRGQMIRQ